MYELNEFLKDLGAPEESFLDKPLVETEPEKEDTDIEERKKNRYTRRREAEAQRLRDEVTQLTERVKVLSEVDKFKSETGSDDYIAKVRAIYGTTDADGKYDPNREAASNLLEGTLRKIEETAVEKALAKLEERQGSETEAQKEADSEVDEMLEQVEDEYDLDMSDDNVRRGFITLMEKMSKKYDDGNIKEFADHNAVAETYLALQKRQGSSKARELASRSMTHSGESQPSQLPQNAVDRFMQENGLTGNW